MLIDPAEAFPGTILLTVPHMDDCVLACGGTIARLPDKGRVHVVYATDGTRSPGPVLPWQRAVAADLNAIRMAEARSAMGYLGVAETNIRFLNLPDGRLSDHAGRLHCLLVDLLDEIRPAHIFTPFRFDRHCDHLALNRVVTAAHRQVSHGTQLLEYFVYYRWHLLPQKDVRKCIFRQHLQEVDLSGVTGQKRDALSRFGSQTTRFYSWQRRPNLTPQLLDEVSRSPELFLKYDPALPGTSVFASSATLVRVIHRLEPYMKARKDQTVAILGGGLRWRQSRPS